MLTWIKHVYHLAFTEYFFVMPWPGRGVLALSWIAGCTAGGYFAYPVGIVAAIASPIVLSLCFVGIWAYIGYQRQRGSL